MAKIPKKLTQKKSPKIEEEEIPKVAEAAPEDSEEESNEEDGDEEAPKLKSNTEIEHEEEEDADYLRPFQYKKVNDKPMVGGILTDPDKGSRAEVMKASLLTQPRISTLIPLPEGSDPKVLYSVTLNGYRLDLPTNTYIFIPKQVADIVRNSNDQTVKALNQFQISDKAKNEAGL